jgi:hypothetical protein
MQISDLKNLNSNFSKYKNQSQSDAEKLIVGFLKKLLVSTRSLKMKWVKRHQLVQVGLMIEDRI